jgi:hypothetical protein
MSYFVRYLCKAVQNVRRMRDGKDGTGRYELREWNSIEEETPFEDVLYYALDLFTEDCFINKPPINTNILLDIPKILTRMFLW